MYGTSPLNALNKDTEELLWHIQLAHGGDHNHDSLYKHIDGIPNFSNLKFDDMNKWSTCLRVKLTKNTAGHQSLRNHLTSPYQGLYVDFGFSGKVHCDDDGELIESLQEEVKGINGESSWILICDGKTQMLHGDCCLPKANKILLFLPFWILT